MSIERLDKIISSQLNISRKNVKDGIRKGLASVNGVCVRQCDIKVEALSDKILFDGQAVNYKRYVYILMNKPKGVLSASTDAKRKTVVDLVPETLKRQGLSPVGRLDKDTTGLLIITDDGDFAHNVISPKKHVMKTYIASLDGDVTPDMIQKFKEGVTLADGESCRTAILEALGKGKARITVFEGKYHQIKRMFGTVGLGVDELHRESLGSLKLPENLLPGMCVELDQKQLEMVYK